MVSRVTQLPFVPVDVNGDDALEVDDQGAPVEGLHRVEVAFEDRLEVRLYAETDGNTAALSPEERTAEPIATFDSVVAADEYLQSLQGMTGAAAPTAAEADAAYLRFGNAYANHQTAQAAFEAAQSTLQTDLQLLPLTGEEQVAYVEAFWSQPPYSELRSRVQVAEQELAASLSGSNLQAVELAAVNGDRAGSAARFIAVVEGFQVLSGTSHAQQALDWSDAVLSGELLGFQSLLANTPLELLPAAAGRAPGIDLMAYIQAPALVSLSAQLAASDPDADPYAFLESVFSELSLGYPPELTGEDEPLRLTTVFNTLGLHRDLMLGSSGVPSTAMSEALLGPFSAAFTAIGAAFGLLAAVDGAARGDWADAVSGAFLATRDGSRTMMFLSSFMSEAVTLGGAHFLARGAGVLGALPSVIDIVERLHGPLDSATAAYVSADLLNIAGTWTLATGSLATAGILLGVSGALWMAGSALEQQREFEEGARREEMAQRIGVEPEELLRRRNLEERAQVAPELESWVSEHGLRLHLVFSEAPVLATNLKAQQGLVRFASEYDLTPSEVLRLLSQLRLRLPAPGEQALLAISEEAFVEQSLAMLEDWDAAERSTMLYLARGDGTV